MISKFVNFFHSDDVVFVIRIMFSQMSKNFYLNLSLIL